MLLLLLVTEERFSKSESKEITNTQAFKEWFKDSKVVDEYGNQTDKRKVALVMKDIPAHEAPYYQQVFGDEGRFL